MQGSIADHTKKVEGPDAWTRRGHWTGTRAPLARGHGVVLTTRGTPTV